jgi:type II secretory pathway pseudopilin PulG
MEMMVVIGLVAILATMTLPSVIALYNAGADSQAYNLVAAQLTAARALAIEKGTFAGLHVQLADARLTPTSSQLLRPKLENACFTALVLYDPDKRLFKLQSRPQRVPGSMAFGKLTKDTVDGRSYTTGAEDVAKFTTFTVVFSGYGSAVTTINGRTVEFDKDDDVFRSVTASAADIIGERRLWDYANANAQNAVTALTLFDMGRYYNLENKRGDKRYLEINAQFLPLNVYTGQLFPRE